MQGPAFNEYTVSPDGVSSLNPEYGQPAIPGPPPPLTPDMVLLVIEQLPLKKKIELFETPTPFPGSIRRFLRETKIQQIMISKDDAKCVVYADVTIQRKAGDYVEFEGLNNRITLGSYLRMYNYVMKILAYCDCSNATVCIEPFLFPDGLAMIDLSARSLHHGVVLIKELQFGYGAPLQLFAQVKAASTSIDTMFSNVRNGAEAIAEQIRLNHIVPIQ